MIQSGATLSVCIPLYLPRFSVISLRFPPLPTYLLSILIFVSLPHAPRQVQRMALVFKILTNGFFVAREGAYIEMRNCEYCNAQFCKYRPVRRFPIATSIHRHRQQKAELLLLLHSPCRKRAARNPHAILHATSHADALIFSRSHVYRYAHHFYNARE